MEAVIPVGKRVRRSPLGVQVIRVADAIDAMLSDRAYRKTLSVGEYNHPIRAVLWDSI